MQEACSISFVLVAYQFCPNTWCLVFDSFQVQKARELKDELIQQRQQHLDEKQRRAEQQRLSVLQEKVRKAQEEEAKVTWPT